MRTEAQILMYRNLFAATLAGVAMSQSGCQTGLPTEGAQPISVPDSFRVEKQITTGPRGRILTNTGVWSPDGQWIVYDTRSDAPGESFNGSTIEMVNLNTYEVREIYRSKNGAHCGVVTSHPRERQVVVMLGPEDPTESWA